MLFAMSMMCFTEWLSGTAASRYVQDKFWIIPTVQCVHIIAVAMVFSSVVMIDLRILGLIGRSQSMSQTAGRFMPWIWGGLAVLALSGSLLIIGEPARELLNVAFWIKISMLAVAIGVTAGFQRTLSHAAAVWEVAPGRRRWMNVLATTTVFLWMAIATAGRWIAYANPE
jgi:hypothetical protein